MSSISFEILEQDRETQARRGLIRTRHGDIETPYLVPVATLASVRALGSDDLIRLGVQCTLANTYHLHLEPGDELIARLGGLHRFMGFDRPTFTDSGGFQAFSLGFAREHNISKIGNIFPQELTAACEEKMEEKGEMGFGYRPHHKRSPGPKKKENLTRISDEGISFKSSSDGEWHFLSPEKSMKIQSNLGADIIMAFDECTSPLSDYDYTRKAMLRSHDWAEESIRFHDRGQALYGIIQGGWFEDLRRESTQAI